MSATWTVRRVRSKFAKGIVDSGQGHDRGPRRLYTSEDAALTRVCEDLERIAEQHRIDPQPTAVRKGNSIVVTADAAEAVYIVQRKEAAPRR